MTPHLGFLLLLGLLVNAIEAWWAQLATTVVLGWLCVGVFVVFGLLRVPFPQRDVRVDFRGAFRTHYFAAWWPWYAIGHVQRSKR